MQKYVEVNLNLHIYVATQQPVTGSEKSSYSEKIQRQKDFTAETLDLGIYVLYLSYPA